MRSTRQYRNPVGERNAALEVVGGHQDRAAKPATVR